MVAYSLLIGPLIIVLVGALDSDRCNGSLFRSSGCGYLDLVLPGPVSVTNFESNCSSIATITFRLRHREKYKVALPQGEQASFFDPPLVVDAVRVGAPRSSCCTVTGRGCSSFNADRAADPYPPRPPHSHVPARRVVPRHGTTSGESKSHAGGGSVSIGFVIIGLCAPLILTIALAMGCCHSHQEQKDAFFPDSSSVPSTKEPYGHVRTMDTLMAEEELINHTEPAASGLPALSSASITAHDRVLCSPSEASASIELNAFSNPDSGTANSFSDNHGNHPGIVAPVHVDTAAAALEGRTAPKTVVTNVESDFENGMPHENKKGPEQGNELPLLDGRRLVAEITPPTDMGSGTEEVPVLVVVPDHPATNPLLTIPASHSPRNTVTEFVDAGVMSGDTCIDIENVDSCSKHVSAMEPGTVEDRRTELLCSCVHNSIPNVNTGLEALAPNSENPVAIADNLMSSSENPVAIADNLMSRSENPVATADNLMSHSENPVAIPDTTISCSENPVATGDNLMPQSQNPVATGDNLISHSESPVAIADNLTFNSENPVATGDTIMSHSENPVATGDNLTPQSENSVAIADNLTSNPENPVAILDNLMSHSGDPMLISDISVPSSDNLAPNPENPVNLVSILEASIPNLDIAAAIAENCDVKDQIPSVCIVSPGPDSVVPSGQPPGVAVVPGNLSVNHFPRSASLHAVSNKYPVSKTSSSSPDLSCCTLAFLSRAPCCAAPNSTVVDPSAPAVTPDPEDLVHDFVCMISNQPSPVLNRAPSCTGSELLADCFIFAQDVDSSIASDSPASEPYDLEPECMVCDFMRLISGAALEPDNPVPLPGPQSWISQPSQLVLPSVGCLFTSVALPHCPPGENLVAGVLCARSLPTSLHECVQQYCKEPDPPDPAVPPSEPNVQIVVGPQVQQDASAPGFHQMPGTPAVLENSLLPPTEVQPLLSPTSKVPPEEPIYDTVKSCTESADYKNSLCPPKEPIYHVLEKPCTQDDQATLGSQFGSIESIVTVTDSLSSWSSEEFDEPVYHAPSEKRSSMISETSDISLSSLHASRCSSRAGSCRHVTTPPPNVRCSVEPHSADTPTPSLEEDEEGPPLPCPRKPVTSGHIYEMLKVKSRSPCDETKSLTEENVQSLSSKKKQTLSIKLGSLRSLGSQGSHCSSEVSSSETLATSPMYVDPVDFIPSVSNKPHLEPPPKVNPWSSKRGSGSFLKKNSTSTGPVQDQIVVQLDTPPAPHKLTPPQVAMSVEEVWQSQQENLYAPLTFVKTASLKVAGHKTDETVRQERPLNNGPSPCHANLNKTASFSLLERSRHTNTPLGTSL